MTRIESLLEVVKTSPHLLGTELARLFDTEQAPTDTTLSLLLYKLVQNNPAQTVAPCLSELAKLVSRRKGSQSAFNVLSRVEVALGFRQPALGIYDNAFHFIGGAQKYGCTIAHALQDEFDVTMIANTDISRQQLEEWYDLDLSKCRIKILKMPYFEKKERQKGVFDAGEVDLRGDNPFHLISKESGNYDIFVNNCMLEMVYPLANLSEFVCHFPEREISRFFHVGDYSHIIFNSLYTADWIKKRWNLEPSVHIYPPVDMETAFEPDIKENVILSASRFEVGGNKQQIEMIKAFVKLSQIYPDTLSTWRLVLVGGSIPENPYMDKVKSLLSSLPESRVELKVNISAEELREIYGRAKIFWHFCGYKQKDPAKFEHFGMTAVEAMQNACVPVVFDGGGLREIVEDQISGFLFKDMASMTTLTLDLIQNPSRLTKLCKAAHTRGKAFAKKIFITRVQDHFSGLLRTYSFQNLDKELPGKEAESE